MVSLPLKWFLHKHKDHIRIGCCCVCYEKATCFDLKYWFEGTVMRKEIKFYCDNCAKSSSI